MVSNERSYHKEYNVKYESPSTYESKVMTKVKVLLADRQSVYYQAPAIRGP
jgi:hypothetical protein